MPICPGCERVVSYEQLPTHEQYCDGLSEGSHEQAERLEALASEMSQTSDSLSRRVRSLEARLEAQLAEVDRREQYRR
ncbi:hypothetical protein [Halobellus sp. GM3]|uniref:hypothetical protein n=1 Tax=Halobellus sp. GM3 TaxID=3458410 RepID=UPI00403D8B23